MKFTMLLSVLLLAVVVVCCVHAQTFDQLDGGANAIGLSIVDPSNSDYDEGSGDLSGDIYFTGGVGGMSVFQFDAANNFPADVSSLPSYNASAKVNSVLSLYGGNVVTIEVGATTVLNVVAPNFTVVATCNALPAGTIGGAVTAWSTDVIVYTATKIYDCDITVGQACSCDSISGGFSSFIGKNNAADGSTDYMYYINSAFELVQYDMGKSVQVFTLSSPDATQPFAYGSLSAEQIFVATYNDALTANSKGYVIDIGTSSFSVVSTVDLGEKIMLATQVFVAPSTVYAITGTTSPLYVVNTAASTICSLVINNITTVNPISLVDINTKLYIGSEATSGDSYLFRVQLPLTGGSCAPIIVNTTTSTSTSTSTSSTTGTSSSNSTSTSTSGSSTTSGAATTTSGAATTTSGAATTTSGAAATTGTTSTTATTGHPTTTTSSAATLIFSVAVIVILATTALVVM